MKKLASPSPLSSLPVTMAIVLAVTISCSVVVVHCSEEVRAQADTDAALPQPDGGHQGPAPPAPHGGTPRGPQPPCCVRPGV
ncbi:unnamed protein product [Urochloa decumbens]|uniref:Secreted protein n=1 Tax=Urochloa decumbens TaxID=240449 RepID=A0ABC8YVJ9_9POAL